MDTGSGDVGERCVPGFYCRASRQGFRDAASGNHAGFDCTSANINRAIQLLESEEDRGVLGPNDVFLLSYIYCLNGSVEKLKR